MGIRKGRMAALLMGSALLVGCAHSPQQLNVQPQVQVPLNPVASRQPVVVVVSSLNPVP